MPNPLIVGIGGSLGSAALGASSANKAASAQTKAADAQVAESRRQFDLVQSLLKPYVTAGTGALSGQMNLMGLNGNPAQETAINDLAGGAQFGALVGQGEEALLANASATGGLRGGNTQGALAQFRPQMLQSLIDRQLAGLGGLAANGQNAAAQTGAAAQTAGGQVINALGDRGAAQAGGYLAQGQAWQNGIGGVMNGIGQGASPMPAGAGLFSKWGF